MPSTEPAASFTKEETGLRFRGPSPSDDALGRLRCVPGDRAGRSEWLRALGRDEELALHFARAIGLPDSPLGEPFPCVLHAGCAARLMRAPNGEIVYHDPGSANAKRQYQTLVELAVAVRTGKVRRLRPLHIALWRVRLLNEAGMITLPAADVPHVTPNSPAYAHSARNGFELLIRCRWFLDPHSPVPYTREFVEDWCGIPRRETRQAIHELLRQRVIVKVGEIPSNYKRPTHLYAPGPTPDAETLGVGL